MNGLPLPNFFSSFHSVAAASRAVTASLLPGHLLSLVACCRWLAGAGAFALHESHEAHGNNNHHGRHRLEEDVAGLAAAGAGLGAWHEHSVEKRDEKLERQLEKELHRTERAEQREARRHHGW